MWAARCRMIHPNGTHGVSSRQRASDEYAQTLIRTKRRTMPVTRRFYMGLPPTKRNPLLAQWEIAFPTRGTGPLDKWVTRKEGPLPQTKRERSSIRRAAEANRQRTNPDETGRTPRSLTISKKSAGKRGRTTGTDTPGRAGVTRRPTPPIGLGPEKRRAQDRGKGSSGGEARPQGARRAPRQLPPRPAGDRQEGLVVVTGTHSSTGGQHAQGMRTNAAEKRPRGGGETAHQHRPATERQMAEKTRPRTGPAAGGRRHADTKRKRPDDRRLEGKRAPSRARAGAAGILAQELSVGEKVPPEKGQGESP
jgi:hypothetical protein